MKIAIAGYGVVGRGTHELLMMNREKIAARAGEEIEVKYVLDPKPLEGPRPNRCGLRGSRRSWQTRRCSCWWRPLAV